MASLSIKNVPEEILQELRRRAERNHRSLQGELMAILEKAVVADEAMSIENLRDQIDSLGLRTEDESTEIVRADRDRS